MPVAATRASAFLLMLVGVGALQGAGLCFEVVDLLREDLQLVAVLLCALCSLRRWVVLIVAA